MDQERDAASDLFPRVSLGLGKFADYPVGPAWQSKMSEADLVDHLIFVSTILFLV